jgi:hypothetical protein
MGSENYNKKSILYSQRQSAIIHHHQATQKSFPKRQVKYYVFTCIIIKYYITVLWLAHTNTHTHTHTRVQTQK